MNHASLFSGVGGFDLAASWMGWENMFNCELDPFCRKVLKYYWPKAIQHEDIKQTDFTIWRGKIEVLTGGFPCQPFSTAGKRKGTADDRYLWPEMLRAIREIHPGWIVAENVPGIINWSRGLVFEQVCADLENEGYEVTPSVLPACGINAPHRRERIWFVANTKGDGHKSRKFGENRQKENKSERKMEERQRLRPFIGGIGAKEASPNPQGIGMEGDGSSGQQEPQTSPGPGLPGRDNFTNGGGEWGSAKDWADFPTQSPVRSRDDGLPAGLSGITISKHSSESIKAYGNSIVPQLAYRIFQAIEKSKKDE